MSNCTAAVVFISMLVSYSASSHARLLVSNSVSYFPVRGTTASSIYTNLVRHGPGGKSGRAMATTNASITHSFKLVQGKRCRLNGYQIRVQIVQRLPRLTSAKRISPSLRRTWNSFYGYLRRHEARHKSIYILCARRIETAARRLARSSSRSGLSGKINRVRYRETAKCEALHSAYDRREANRIKRLGLIRRATKTTYKFKRKAGRKRH